MLDFIHGSVQIGDQTVKFPFPNPNTVHTHKIASASASTATANPHPHRDIDAATDASTNDTHSHFESNSNNKSEKSEMNYSLVEVLHKASPESTGIWYNGEIVDAHVSKKGEITGYDIRLEKLVQSGGPNNEATVELITEKFAADKVRSFMSKEKADDLR